ncbi:MAG: endonuclease/exonuclease/phosphatase family protein [Tepidisphaeraceae bacterium]
MRFCRLSPLPGALCLITLGLCVAPVRGQIRVVSYNTETAFNTNGNPNAGLQNVLSGMGTESVNGIAKRIDILCLQEQNNSTGTTTSQILTMMNNLYGAGTYAKSTLIGNSTTPPTIDSAALIWDTTKFSLVQEVAIGTVSGSGMPRQEIRYQMRPVGYDTNSDFYVYVGHWKANGTPTDMDRRNIEAQTIRANANLLPAGSRVLYVGDMNLTGGTSEPAWTTLTGAGTGPAGIDPAGGSWTAPNLTWSTTNLGSRLDFQMQTAPTNDGHGFSLMSGSYHPFNSPGVAGGQSPNSNVRSASDHYPVVADYRYPAKMSVAMGSAPGQVIVGATATVSATLTNSAPVAPSTPTGADGLDYSGSGAGALSGSAGATGLLALSAGNVHNFTFNTATPGVKNGTVSFTSTSQEVANGSFTSSNVSTTVLAHSNASFLSGSDSNALSIDFGIIGWTLDPVTQSYGVFNLADVSGFTAKLDLDSVVGSGATARLLSGATTFTNQSAGGSHAFDASIDTSTLGLFAATYTFNVSDENLAGATSGTSLTLNLSGRVAIPGDTDLNGVIDLDDYANTDGGYLLNLGGWGNGDFDGDGDVDLDDFALIDGFYLMQGGGRFDAVMGILDDPDAFEADELSPGMAMIQLHALEFGSDYASAFVAMVPEPGSALLLALGAVGFLSRRRMV